MKNGLINLMEIRQKEPYNNMVKTTIELDEKKLIRLMKLTGIKTRKEAIDYALTEAERVARINAFYQHDFYVDSEGPIIDPQFDLLALRHREKPSRRK
jgi:hypothetical protein